MFIVIPPIPEPPTPNNPKALSFQVLGLDDSLMIDFSVSLAAVAAALRFIALYAALAATPAAAVVPTVNAAGAQTLEYSFISRFLKLASPFIALLYQFPYPP